MRDDRIRPSGIKPFPDAEDFEVSPSDRRDLVTIIQIMLCSLKIYYDEFGDVSPVGTYDGDTENAVRCFQRSSGLPETGCVDVVTWNRLAEEFNASIYENL